MSDKDTKKKEEEAERMLQVININKIIDSWNVNTITEDHLTDIKNLAAGGQGKVMKAKFYGMNIVIKELFNFTSHNYVKEIEHVYKYRHPYIPKFFGFYKGPNNKLGIIFEFIQGKGMDKLISHMKKGKVSLSFMDRLDMMIQLASIIEFLHDHRLIHRDLKPENIMVDEMGKIKLLDYGIAIKEEESIVDANGPEVAYTPNYICPEVWDSMDDEDDMSDLEEMETAEQTIKKTGKLTGADFLNQEGLEEKGPKIHYTDKVDVWTFGLIFSEFMCLVAPWSLTKAKDKPLKQIETALTRKKAYPMPKTEMEPYQEQLIHDIVGRCTKLDPKKRPSIKEIKEDMIKHFYNEVKKEKEIAESKKFEDKKPSAEEASKPKKKNRKQIKGKFVPSSQRQGGTLVARAMRKNQIDNRLLKMMLQKTNQNRRSIAILKHVKNDLFMGNSLARNTSFSGGGMVAKKYFYMTYDDAIDQIQVMQFPDKQFIDEKDVFKQWFTSRSLKNPYCLNFRNDLYILGGKLHSSGVVSLKRTLSKLEASFGEATESKTFFKFSGSDRKIAMLPSMIEPRANHSCVVIKNNIFCAGGESLLVESYDLTEEKAAWKERGTLMQEAKKPLLGKFKDQFLIVLTFCVDDDFIEVQTMDTETGETKLCYCDFSSIEEMKDMNVGNFQGIFQEPLFPRKIFVLTNCYKQFDSEELKVMKNIFGIKKPVMLEIEIVGDFPSIEYKLKKFTYMSNLNQGTTLKFNAGYGGISQLFDNAFRINNSDKPYIYGEHLFSFSRNGVTNRMMLKKINKLDFLPDEYNYFTSRIKAKSQ